MAYIRSKGLQNQLSAEMNRASSECHVKTKFGYPGYPNTVLISGGPDTHAKPPYEEGLEKSLGGGQDQPHAF